MPGGRSKRGEGELEKTDALGRKDSRGEIRDAIEQNKGTCLMSIGKVWSGARIVRLPGRKSKPLRGSKHSIRVAVGI